MTQNQSEGWLISIALILVGLGVMTGDPLMTVLSCLFSIILLLFLGSEPPDHWDGPPGKA